MPVYHSHFNDKVDNFPLIAKFPLLPIKTKFKGPAGQAKSDERDIIDEALFYFRANVLFQSFEVKNPADLLLIECTLLIQMIIKKLKPYSTRTDAKKQVQKIMHDNSKLPSDNSHPLHSLCSKPDKSSDAEKLRNYLTQLRKEILTRTLDLLYSDDGTQNKWWFQFHKMKFMGMELK